MKRFLFLVVLVLLGLVAYGYFIDPSLLEKHAPALAALIKSPPEDTVAAGIVAPESAKQAPAAQTAAPARADMPPASASQATTAAGTSSRPPATAQVASPSQSALAASSVAPAAPAVNTIKLKNGKVITGKVIVTDPDITWIRMEDGKTQEVKTKDILSGLPLLR